MLRCVPRRFVVSRRAVLFVRLFARGFFAVRGEMRRICRARVAAVL
jgi:hypothetical protein